MALSALKFRPDGRQPEETKQGYIVFDGRVADYTHWEFRSRMKMMAVPKTGDDRAEKYLSLIHI